MRMPLVSKFLYYLDAAARMELAGISHSCQNHIVNVYTGKERKPSTNRPDPLEESYCRLLSFPPPSCRRQSHPPSSICRTKNPQTHPESISLGANEVGQRGFRIFIRTWFQSPIALVYPLVSFTHNYLGRLRQGNVNASGYCSEILSADSVVNVEVVFRTTQTQNTTNILVDCDYTMNYGGRHRTTAAIVPHPWLQCTETLANRLCNNAT